MTDYSDLTAQLRFDASLFPFRHDVKTTILRAADEIEALTAERDRRMSGHEQVLVETAYRRAIEALSARLSAAEAENERLRNPGVYGVEGEPDDPIEVRHARMYRMNVMLVRKCDALAARLSAAEAALTGTVTCAEQALQRIEAGGRRPGGVASMYLRQLLDEVGALLASKETP